MAEKTFTVEEEIKNFQVMTKLLEKLYKKWEKCYSTHGF